MCSYLLIKDGTENIKDDNTETTGKWEVGCGVALVIILVLLLLSMMWCRKRISLAIEMLHEAGHAIRDMKFTVFFPPIYSIVAMLYMAFWVAVALYIYSVKIKKTGTTPDSLKSALGDEYIYYDFDESMKDALGWHFVCLLYIMQVIIYFGFMVLAGVIADWYFSDWQHDLHLHRKIRGNGPAELSHAPICESLWRVLRYHIGSLAFGSAVITIIRLIRAAVTYMEKKTKAVENPLAKCIFCCAQCCLKVKYFTQTVKPLFIEFSVNFELSWFFLLFFFVIFVLLHINDFFNSVVNVYWIKLPKKDLFLQQFMEQDFVIVVFKH